jgi:DNA-binding response OmpR family regulator
MPGLNGVESFLEIRKLRPQAKVFMMTGYSVEQLLHQAMDHGAMGVLAKPLDAQKLLKAMADATPNGIVVVSEATPQFGRHVRDIMARAGIGCDLLLTESDDTAEAAAVTIIDLGKPLIAGVDVYTRLRRCGRIRPAIIVTRPGADGGDVFDALRDVAVTGILNKPFDPVALLDRLDILAA